MNKSFWGYVVIVLGVIAIVLIWNFTQITNLDQHNYNLLKETVESAMLDSVDISAYRNDGTIRIVEEKFVENFIRRYAESAELSNTYEIEIYDVNETPPKVSLKVTSYKATDAGIKGAGQIFTISNNIDAILETRYTEELNTYKLTYDNAGGSGCTYTSASYNTPWGTLCNPTRNGYKFVGWYIDETELTGEELATKNITATAKWQQNAYTLTYDNNGGTGCSSKTGTYGSTWGTLCNPTKTDTAFAGWYTSKTGGTKVTSSTKVTSDLTVYAHWNEWTEYSTNYCNTTTYPTTMYDKESKNQYRTRTETPVYKYHFYKDYYTDWSDSDAKPTTSSSLSIVGGPYSTKKYKYFRYYGSVNYVSPKKQNTTPNLEFYITSTELTDQGNSSFDGWKVYGWAQYGSGPNSAWYIEGNNNTPTYHQYRYKMRHYITSSSSTYPGYKCYDKTTTYKYGNWGSWVDGTQPASDTIEIQTVCRVRQK